MKRILPWKKVRPGVWAASTLVMPYEVWDFAPEPLKFGATRLTSAWPRKIGQFDTLDAAMDACEADYLARCSEFLPVAGPGECVVSIADMTDTLVCLRSFAARKDAMTADVRPAFDALVSRLTAAIDAAKGE